MKDKLQEAAAEYANQFKVCRPQTLKTIEIVGLSKQDFIAGAQYQSEIDKEAIRELVSALEIVHGYNLRQQHKGLPEISFTIMEHIDSIIQKHKQ